MEGHDETAQQAGSAERGGDRAALSTRLKALEGRYVRVRGWLVKRNGPFIALAGAEAIEELPEGLGSADMR
jgi:hypothetical protein